MRTYASIMPCRPKYGVPQDVQCTEVAFEHPCRTDPSDVLGDEREYAEEETIGDALKGVEYARHC